MYARYGWLATHDREMYSHMRKVYSAGKRTPPKVTGDNEIR
jgi:hypothetical protein